MDYRGMFDREHIGAWDLEGRDVTVTIARVHRGELTGEGGRKTKKPILTFEGKEKTFAANKTNCRIIAEMYGTDTREWIGKRITLWPTTTEMSGKTHDCIRVRPRVPTAPGGDEPRRTGGGAASKQAPSQPPPQDQPPLPEAPND